MAVGRTGSHPARGMGRDCTVFAFEFDTNGTSAPDGLVDPGGVVSAMTYSATGNHVATLNDRYVMLAAVASHDDADAIGELEVRVSDGTSAANTITIQTWSDADPQVAATSTNLHVTVLCMAYPHAG